MKVEHLDEDGKSCERHVANPDAVLVWAAIGSRVASFNHDIASKLQGLMMALDEIAEIVEREGNNDLARATETAQESLKDASAMLSANRLLTRTSTRTKSTLRDLVQAASERVGVGVHGDAGDGQIEAVALLAQGLALALDAIAGAGRNRTVEVVATREGDRVKLVVSSTAEWAKTAGEALGLAAFVIARAGGEMRCGTNRITVQLPVIA